MIRYPTKCAQPKNYEILSVGKYLNPLYIMYIMLSIFLFYRELQRQTLHNTPQRAGIREWLEVIGGGCRSLSTTIRDS